MAKTCTEKVCCSCKIVVCLLDLLPFDVVVSFAVVRFYSSRKRSHDNYATKENLRKS